MEKLISAASSLPTNSFEPNPIFTYPDLENKFLDAFGDILPSQEHRHFPLSKAPLYINDRHEKNTATQDERAPGHTDSGMEYRQEKLLDEQFWNHAAAKIVILKGPVGTGKTTLLNFYLRSYCPNLSPNRQRFEEKLCIIVDLKLVRQVDQFISLLNSRMTDDILTRCSSINYPIEQKPDVGKARQNGDVLWPQRALVHIRNQIDAGNEGIPFRYLVICLDNLDQCSTEVQKRAIHEVREWVSQTSPIHPYRVFISMWPKTFDAIQHTFGEPLPLNSYFGFDLLSLNSASMHATRTAVIKTQADRIPGSEFADRARALTNEPRIHKLSRFITAAADGFNRHFSPLHKATCGNLRSLLKCQRNLLQSKRLYEIFSKQSQTPLSQYDVLEACLVGAHKWFNRQQSGIPNLYGMIERFPLLAIHFLSFLDISEEIPSQRVIESLKTLGYPEYAISELLEQFSESDCQPFYSVTNTYSHDTFIVDNSAVSGLLEFCYEAVYIDTVSVTTPVSGKFRSEMRVTSSVDHHDFVARVTASIAFIDYIYECETAFVERLANSTSGNHRESVRAIFAHQVKLPMIAERMRAGYLKRISGLKSKGHLKDVPSNFWVNVEAKLSTNANTLPANPYWELESI